MVCRGALGVLGYEMPAGQDAEWGVKPMKEQRQRLEKCFLQQKGECLLRLNGAGKHKRANGSERAGE